MHRGHALLTNYRNHPYRSATTDSCTVTADLMNIDLTTFRVLCQYFLHVVTFDLDLGN